MWTALICRINNWKSQLCCSCNSLALNYQIKYLHVIRISREYSLCNCFCLIRRFCVEMPESNQVSHENQYCMPPIRNTLFLVSTKRHIWNKKTFPNQSASRGSSDSKYPMVLRKWYLQMSNISCDSHFHNRASRYHKMGWLQYL